jgi:hypothetical protein
MSELKVTADHLKRDAYLYVRQSTLRQVAENGESTQRQYALRHRAIAAGWPAERVRVIDRDLGKSGSTAAARRLPGARQRSRARPPLRPDSARPSPAAASAWFLPRAVAHFSKVCLWFPRPM